MASQTQVWNSDDDDGDELFQEHDTVATLPLDTAGAPREDPSHKTQHITQPTQPLPRSPPTPGVQVPVSSPSQHTSTSSKPAISPVGRGALNHGFASAMAPPGTQFRNPVHGWQTKESQPPVPDLTQSSQLNIDTDSSDDELSNNNIRPTFFEKGSSAQRVEDSPRGNFSMLASAFSYSPASPKRSSDAMADAYGASARRPKVARLNDAAAKSPAWNHGIRTFDDIPDVKLIQKAKRIHNIIPKYSAFEVYTALMKTQSDETRALSWLADEDDRKSRLANAVDLTVLEDDSTKLDRTKASTKRGIQGPVRSINEKWSHGRQQPPSHADSSFIQSILNRGQESNKRMAPPSKSIGEKWSSVSRVDSDQQPRSVKTSEDKKPRKRLVQGRKSPVDSSPLAKSPMSNVQALESPSRPAQPTRKAVQVIEEDDEGDESDSGVGSTDEIGVHNDILNAKILSFINSCTLEDLIDVSSQPSANAETVLGKRPFASLDDIRAVVYETTSTTKTGKIRRAKQTVGQRLCDVLEEIFEGYEAVDELVAKCEELGKPVAAEMRHWGFNAFGTSQQGELELVDLTSSHDSGIGTPSSSTGSNADEPDEGPSARVKARKLLQQPNIMSSDLTMKDYQVAGLNWLALLFSQKLSCILADDMGLGKTCQVISFLAHLHESSISVGPHLIIVPGSTLENWLREFRNFCPKLRVEPYYGKQAERVEMQYTLRDQIEQINVIVTTYDMASKREDASFLRKLKPVVCVYDEGHALKNSQSQRYRELMRIPAKFRLLLTGTPLQNNLQELISLLAFIMPQVFSEKEEILSNIFKHRAKTTDTKHTALLNAERISKARSMMTPFILRRKKHQVLKDIPKKTSNIVHCDLAADQRVLYDEHRAEVCTVLLKKDTNEESQNKKRGSKVNNSTKLSNNVLMDLRKAAIHPLLFRRLYTDKIIKELARAYCKSHPECTFELVREDLSIMTDFELNRWCNNEENSANSSIYRHRLKGTPWMDSGKVAELVRVLKENIKRGDRTLVFSQFTMVMDILELVFDTASIGFYRLDGSTLMQTRQDLLDQFHSDDTPVFMLSTKAGGAGINLACANKVVIFDMSFNPQDDVQAENRAHRVGQKREVEVIRLVSRDTIEEQILRLGESKLALDAKVAGELYSDRAAEEDEKKGAALIEAMLKEQLINPSGDRPAENSQDKTPTVKSTKATDLKVDYLNGLKAAGLDMSAAAE